MIVIVAGPSGVGKGSIVTRILEEDPRFWLSRSWNTRPQRPGEADDAYIWVDREQFLAHAERGGFIEWFEVYDDLKGTPVPDPPAGRDILFEVDLQGARTIKEREPDALLVFVRPPSREEQERRMRGRGDREADIARRITRGDAEEALGVAVADHVVVNDDLDRAVAEVRAAIEVARRGGGGGRGPG